MTDGPNGMDGKDSKDSSKDPTDPNQTDPTRSTEIPEAPELPSEQTQAPPAAGESTVLLESPVYESDTILTETSAPASLEPPTDSGHEPSASVEQPTNPGHEPSLGEVASAPEPQPQAPQAQAQEPAQDQPQAQQGPSPWPEHTLEPGPSEPTGGGWKARLTGWGQGLAQKIQHLEPMQAAEWANRAFQKQGTNGWGKALTLALCAWFLADLSSLLLGKYVPEPPPAPLSRVSGSGPRARSIEEYNIIFTRNLFNSKGLIPGEDQPSGLPTQDGPPVRTSLQLQLVGTLILRDELRSIATIEDKSANMVYPVRVQDEIPTKATILSIEPRKVVFINISNGRKEFIDLPEDEIVGNARIQLGAPPPGPRGAGIEKVSPTQFNVSRTEVDKTLQDLNRVLTEARAVPNFENGVPAGYKLFQIVPGSIYDKLGLQNGDVIAGLNGAAINDPGKAFEMLSELKTANHLELQVKKDGVQKTYVYDIR